MTSYYLNALWLAIPAVLAAPTSTLHPAIEKAFDLYTALPSELIPVLQEAKDKSSADKAATKLHKKLQSIYITREAVHNIPTMTAEQRQLVEARYSKRMRREWAKMYEEIERIRMARCFESAELWNEFRTMCMMIEK